MARRLSGELTEDLFLLSAGDERLLYLQLHAYMLRIVLVPYGTLSSRQVRKLAYIARILMTRILARFHHPP